MKTEKKKIVSEEIQKETFNGILKILNENSKIKEFHSKIEKDHDLNLYLELDFSAAGNDSFEEAEEILVKLSEEKSTLIKGLDTSYSNRQIKIILDLEKFDGKEINHHRETSSEQNGQNPNYQNERQGLIRILRELGFKKLNDANTGISLTDCHKKEKEPTKRLAVCQNYIQLIPLLIKVLEFFPEYFKVEAFKKPKLEPRSILILFFEGKVFSGNPQEIVSPGVQKEIIDFYKKIKPDSNSSNNNNDKGKDISPLPKHELPDNFLESQIAPFLAGFNTLSLEAQKLFLEKVNGNQVDERGICQKLIQKIVENDFLLEKK